MADEPMADERLAEIRASVANINERGRYSGAVSPSEVIYASDASLLLAEVDRLRAREAAAMAIVVELARQDDRNNINCTCREMMPVGHSSDCYLFRAHMMAHQLPDGSYE